MFSKLMHILPATLVNLSNCSHYYGKHAWKASRNPRKRSAFPSEGDAGKRSLGKESVQIQVIDNKKAQLGLPSCWAWEDGAFVFKKHLDFSTSAKVPAPLKPCVSRPCPQQRKTLSPKPIAETSEAVEEHQHPAKSLSAASSQASSAIMYPYRRQGGNIRLRRSESPIEKTTGRVAETRRPGRFCSSLK